MATTTKAARFTKGKERFYEIDGAMLPSVTTILSTLAKPALVNWAAKLTRERMCDEAADLYDVAAGPSFDRAKFRAELWKRVEKRAFQNETAREAADLGTLAHARCEWMIQKRLGVAVGDDPIAVAAPGSDAERALWASLSFEDWMARNKVEPIATEVVVAHLGHGYAGTADLIARVDGRVALVDLKTSSGIWPEMYLQVAAYAAALNSRCQLADRVETAYILRLPKKVSDPEFEAVEVDRLDFHLNGFLSLFGAWLWQSEVTR